MKITGSILLLSLSILLVSSCEKKKLEDEVIVLPPRPGEKLYVKYTVNDENLVYLLGENNQSGITYSVDQPAPEPVPRLFILDIMQDSAFNTLPYFSFQFTNYQVGFRDIQNDLTNLLQPGEMKYSSAFFTDPDNPYQLKTIALFHIRNEQIYGSPFSIPLSSQKFEILTAEDLVREGKYYRKIRCRFNCTLTNVMNPMDSLVLKDGEAEIVISDQEEF